MIEKRIDDLLDQRVEEQAHYLDNTHSLLAYGKIPSSLFLLTKTVSFYSKNFLRVLFLSTFYFLLVIAVFVAQLFYIANPLVALVIPSLLLLVYICTFANLVLEEENTIFDSTKYAVMKLLPVLYSCVIFIAIICGFALLAFIPEFAFLHFFPDSNLFKIFGGIIFAILLISVVAWYCLFLFVAVDESKYGFKSLFRSKAYVGVNFPDFLRRLVVCVAMVPVVFTGMIFVVQGVLKGVDLVGGFFEIEYSFHLLDSVYDKLLYHKIDFAQQMDLLKSWFVKIVFVIPFVMIYLGFLYSTLSCENPLPPQFSGSRTHKILLGIFLIIGVVAITIVAYNFLSPSQSLHLPELNLGWKF
jgi:hypothetical protein